MRISRTATMISVLGALGVTHAQVMTNDELQAKPTPAVSSPTPIPDITAEPTIPERNQIDQIFKQTSLGKDADDQRLHVEWRQLENRVVNQPDIVAAKKAAESAHTDLEKRQRLRTYYDLYYGRLRQMASTPEMKTALEQWRIAHISRTSQPRVRPIEDGALPTPSATPKKKEKGGRLRKFQSDQ